LESEILVLEEHNLRIQETMTQMGELLQMRGDKSGEKGVEMKSREVQIEGLKRESNLLKERMDKMEKER